MRGGTEDEVALNGNRAAFDQLVFHIDGGFRRGTDVLKVIALGAKLVFMGRLQLYGAELTSAYCGKILLNGNNPSSPEALLF